MRGREARQEDAREALPRWPSLVIAGAPKCGTTSLFNWLAGHPQVCTARVKETRYFVDAGYPLRLVGPNFHTHGMDAYPDYFPCSEHEHHRMTVEATPDYLYQETALVNLGRIDPCPRLLFLLRRPSHRILSLYRFATNNMAVLPKEFTFQSFVAMAGRHDSPIGENLILRSSIEHSRYVEYLLRWRSRYDRARIIIVLFEDLVADPRRFMSGLCLTLGMDGAWYEQYEFTSANTSYAVRSQTLQRLKRALEPVLEPLARGRWRNPLKRLYKSVNVTGTPRTPSADEREVLAMLDARFEPCNERLSREFGLDLSAWRSQ